jgi:hypothetical protein
MDTFIGIVSGLWSMDFILLPQDCSDRIGSRGLADTTSHSNYSDLIAADIAYNCPVQELDYKILEQFHVTPS